MLLEGCCRSKTIYLKTGYIFQFHFCTPHFYFQLAQAVRLYLEYTQTDYVDKNYVFTLDMSEWLSEKFTLGLDFPNLPYLLDG